MDVRASAAASSVNEILTSYNEARIIYQRDASRDSDRKNGGKGRTREGRDIKARRATTRNVITTGTEREQIRGPTIRDGLKLEARTQNNNNDEIVHR